MTSRFYILWFNASDGNIYLSYLKWKNTVVLTMSKRNSTQQLVSEATVRKCSKKITMENSQENTYNGNPFLYTYNFTKKDPHCRDIHVYFITFLRTALLGSPSSLYRSLIALVYNFFHINYLKNDCYLQVRVN